MVYNNIKSFFKNKSCYTAFVHGRYDIKLVHSIKQWRFPEAEKVDDTVL